MTSYKNVQTFRAGFLSLSSALKMVAVRSDETTNFQQDTRRHIPWEMVFSQTQLCHNRCI